MKIILSINQNLKKLIDLLDVHSVMQIIRNMGNRKEKIKS